jgi:selenocysteine lyase/cysteine desulfurase
MVNIGNNSIQNAKEVFGHDTWIRISFASYNDQEDADNLLKFLKEID